MLISATLNTESLERIKVSLGIEGEEVKASSCDRPPKMMIWLLQPKTSAATL